MTRAAASAVAVRWLDRAAEAVAMLMLAGVTLLYRPELADNVLGKAAVARALIGVLVLLRAVRHVLDGGLRLPRAPVLLPFALLLAIHAAASVGARNGGLALEHVSGWALWLAWFAVALDLARDRERAARLLRFAFALCVVVAAIGLLQVIGIDPLSLPRRARGMPLSTLGNTNFVAHYLELVLPPAVALAAVRTTPSTRSLAVAALAVGGLHLVLAGSRGGWLGVGLGLGLMALLSSQPRRYGGRLLLAALVAGLLSPVASFVLESIPLRDGVTARQAVDDVAAEAWAKAMSTFDPDNFSRNMRILIWRDSLRLVGDRPLLGVGAGHYALEMPAHRTSTGQREWRDLMGRRREYEPVHAHNDFLEAWAEAGVVGAASLAWLLAAALWTSIRGAARDGSPAPFDRALAAGCAGAVTAAVVHALFSFNLRDPVSASHLWLLAAMANGVVWRARPEGERSVSLASRGRAAAAVGAGGLVAVLSVYQAVCMLMGDHHYLRSERHQIAGHGNRSILALREAVRWRGHEYRYHHDLGMTAAQMGHWREAEQALRRSLELHANNPGALRQLARARLALGRPADAVAPLRQATGIDPLTAANYDLLADALRAAGEAGAAAAARRQAANLAGGPDVMVRLAADHLAAGHADTARFVLEQAARSSPRDGLVLGNLGAVQVEMGLYADAVATLRRALAVDPRAEWRGNLALALAASGQLEAALVEARAAAGAQSNEPKWPRLVAELEARLGHRANTTSEE